MAANDPITKVYEALWTLLEGSSEFTDLVRAANRIKFTSLGAHRDPMKDSVMDADFPEVRIIATSAVPHPLRTSSSSSLLRRFEIQISTGDQRFDERLFPVEWAIYTAMLDWPAVLKLLTWEGEPFIKSLRSDEALVGIDEMELNRGIVGWTTVWQTFVELWFPTNVILPPRPPVPIKAEYKETFVGPTTATELWVYFDKDIAAGSWDEHNWFTRNNGSISVQSAASRPQTNVMYVVGAINPLPTMPYAKGYPLCLYGADPADVIGINTVAVLPFDFPLTVL